MSLKYSSIRLYTTVYAQNVTAYVSPETVSRGTSEYGLFTFI